jgi:membrane associated rhomboid family serine protease
MTTYRNGRGFFEIPHATVYLLITANVVVYGLCLSQSGAAAIPSELLFRSGAMYSLAIERHQYWRLIAYGFLHANLFHLATNMLCLMLWGGHLEKRVGALYFLIIYACAVIFGAVIGNSIHASPYLTVGASGGTSGILGALLCLWILGKIDLLANFFLINIGLNVALAFSNSKIDWPIHLGGFAAGLIACAILDLCEKTNTLVLRCKFPEFVKINIFLIGCGLGLILWGSQSVTLDFNREALLPALECAAGSFLVVKLVDFALSTKKGLAIIVILFSLANAALVWFGGTALVSLLSSSCALRRPGGLAQIEGLLGAACSNSGLTIGVLAALALVSTILLYSQEFYRGIEDVGFVGTSLRAERKRRQGI